MPEKKSAKGWSAVRQHIKNWNSAQLTGLIKDLYASSVDNRVFIDARVQADGEDNGDGGGGEALEIYRARIVEQFYPKRGFGKLKLAEARKAIRDYKKATGKAEGVIDLQLSYLECGTAFTCDFGDIDEPFYNSLCSVMDELAALLKTEGPAAYANAAERLHEIAAQARPLGWGYGDHVNAVVSELADELGK